MKSPLFTSYEAESRTYTLRNHSDSTSYAHFKSQTDNPYVQTELKQYLPPERSPIPCPFCSAANAVLTFRNTSFSGTNTSGGIATTTLEVKCLKCGAFTIFDSEEVTYPYD